MILQFGANRTDEIPDDEDVRAEDVLLQIALAFMMILGFLVSYEVASRKGLRRLLVRAGAQLQSYMGTSISEQARRLREAEEREQLWRLLKSWYELRAEYSLGRLLIVLENRDVGLSAMEPATTADNPMLVAFRDEVVRVYLASPSAKDHSEPIQREVARLVLATAAQAGLELPEPETAVLKLLETESDKRLYQYIRKHAPFERRRASRENLVFLGNEIKKDLIGMEARAVNVQLLAVEKIASSWLSRGRVLGSTGEARDALRMIVAELDRDLRFLPMTRQSLAQAF